MNLPVRLAGRLVGMLSAPAQGPLSFRYDEAWLAEPRAFPISLSLPLGPELVEGAAAHAFFANLLPEGRVRTLVCRRLGLSEENDAALLAAIGGECAGALTIGEAPAEAGYDELESRELADLARAGGALPTMAGRRGVRLSLAGAQDKLPVRIDGGRVLLPLGDAPSTHIIKFPNRDFAHLPANEAIVTALASRMGLPVCEVDLLRTPAGPVLLVRRYDRTVELDGRIRRLHQEDFCQAFGFPPARKYEGEGGPSFAACNQLVVAHSTLPVADTRALLRWAAFNAIVGNADGHAKNLAFLRHDGGDLRLAPFYDLLCTSVYRLIDRHLAMSIGGQNDPGQLQGSHWRALAEEIGVRPTYATDLVREMGDGLPDAVRDVAAQFRERHGSSPALEMLGRALRKQARRMLQLLSE